MCYPGRFAHTMSQAHDTKTGNTGRPTETKRDDYDTAKSGHGTADGAVRDIESGGIRTESDTPHSRAPSSFTKKVVYILLASVVVALCVAAGCYLKQKCKISTKTKAGQQKHIVVPYSNTNIKFNRNLLNDSDGQASCASVQSHNTGKHQDAHTKMFEDQSIFSASLNTREQQARHGMNDQANLHSNPNVSDQKTFEKQSQSSLQNGTIAFSNAPSADIRAVRGQVSEFNEVKYEIYRQSQFLPSLYKTTEISYKSALLLQALNWRKLYCTAVIDDGDPITYSIKPIALTDNVFTKHENLDGNTSALDYGFGVVEREFDETKLNDIDEVMSTFQSEFEWKHYYAYYSILDRINSESPKYPNFRDLLPFTHADVNCTQNSMYPLILQLFNCHVNGNITPTGKGMIQSVMQSDLYNALVSLYAKCACVSDGQLKFFPSYWNNRFPMWYTLSDKYQDISSFKNFATNFLTSMLHALHYCHHGIKNELKKNLNLQAVLQLTLLYRYCQFTDGFSTGEFLNHCLNATFIAHKHYNFASITTKHIKGIPVFAGSNIALLRDAPPNVKALPAH